MQRRVINFDNHVLTSEHSSLPQIAGKDVTLRLSRMDLNDEDIPALTAYLIKHPEINILHVCINDITDEGAIALARIPTLLQLDITFNKIGPKGLIALMYNGTLYDITAGQHVIEQLPPRTCIDQHHDAAHYCRGTQYLRQAAFNKYSVPHEILSLKQLSIFAVRLPPKTLEAMQNNQLSELEPAERVYLDLYCEKDFFNLKGRTPILTCMRESAFPLCQRK